MFLNGIYALAQEYLFHEIRAFTLPNAPVLGNPAMICFIDEFPEHSVMEESARILNSPMTSFVRRTNDPHIFEIRHFSPDGKENHVCGHATVAASELLAQLNPELRNGVEIEFRLNPKYAINKNNAFYVEINGANISLIMPAVVEMQAVTDPEFYAQLVDALGIPEDKIIYPAYFAPRIINYVVEIADEKTLLSMQPDFAKLKALALSKEFPHEGIMATAKSETQGYDILTRVFLPVIDVDEDIACGSSNCSVIPYWTLLRPGVFPEDQNNFNVLFPYPPSLDSGKVGGVQHLSINANTQAIMLTGQATKCREVKLTIEKKANKNPPPPQISKGP